MSNLLDDLRLLKRPPSPQERLAKAIAQRGEALLWEGQAKRSLQQTGLALGTIALLVGMVLSIALQLKMGALASFVEAIKQLIVPLFFATGLLRLYFHQRSRHCLYFGISQQSIWVVHPKNIHRHALSTIEKFELISSSDGRGTIRGLNTIESIQEVLPETTVVVELPLVPEAYDLYQKILHWHSVAQLPPTL